VGGDRGAWFRPDIEGLRAVAIGAVLLYHVGVPWAAGGFVGVDVFFVISGFLITGLLVREWSARGTIDLAAFYARRFRRLLPAALLAITVTTLASWAMLSSLRFPGVAGDAAASALYVSNLRFAVQAVDYLGAEVAPSPLLHFWSLGVEEQFYLFWPLVVLVALRLMAPVRLGWLVGALVVVSFAAAVIWTDIAAPWAFFSLPTRAWQLGVGALIAIGLVRLPVRTPTGLRSLASWAGLALIAASVVLIGPATPYPGIAALLPVMGTALVILGGSAADSRPSRLLGTSIPRFFGRISYSLYLWHWPLLVLVPVALGMDSLLLDLALVGIAVVVAALSTEFLEEPIRQGRLLPLPPRRSLAVAGAASVLVAVGALGASALVIDPGRPGVVASAAASASAPALARPVLAGPLPDGLTPALADAYYDLPDGYRDGCHLDYATIEPPECRYGLPDGGRLVLLLGDSHAQQWLPALEALADDRGWRLRAVTKAACPLVDATVWNQPLKRAYRECDAWRERILEIVAEEEPELVLVASADMYDVLDPEGSPLGSDQAPAWDAGLQTYLGRLVDQAPAVVVLADTPRPGYDPAGCLAEASGIEDCEAARERMVDDGYRAREAAAAREAGADLVDATDWLCTSTACPLVRGSTLVFRDSHHLTATFSAGLSARLGAAIDAVGP
jgi:peptidoglycan/LPS O-acetylase OafA/YrhL